MTSYKFQFLPGPRVDCAAYSILCLAVMGLVSTPPYRLWVQLCVFVIGVAKKLLQPGAASFAHQQGVLHTFETLFQQAAAEGCRCCCCFQGSAKGAIGALLNVVLSWQPTLRCYFFSTQYLRHPVPLIVLALPVNPPHMHMHRRLQPRMYKAHFEPKQLMCACGSEPQTRQLSCLHSLLCASPCATPSSCRPPQPYLCR